MALNLPLMMSGQVWHSFDFSTHVFFASHYQRDWWSLWEPRWFEGFDVASYPPLAHQLAALLGWLIGNGNAVNVLILISVLAFPLAMFDLARRFLGEPVARRSATLAVVAPSVLLAAYGFGQLPTLLALDASLFAAGALGAFAREGRLSRLILGLSLAGVAVAAHHATAIFLLAPLFGTVAMHELLAAADKARTARRALAAAVGLGLVVALVILPFWVWHATEYVVQIPIDHQSRHNLLHDQIAQLLFFWAEHGVLFVALILALPLLRREVRRIAPWYVLAAFLFVIGLGGTTPLPAILFGSQWEWLTYDRFSLWADVPLIMLLGTVAARTLDGSPGPGRRARFAWLLTVAALGSFALADALLPALIQSEPPSVDPRPVVAFLSEGDHARWRYLTLGLGDQMGVLQSLTDAGTIDGEYFTARRLPLLTQSGIAQIDFSLFWDPDAAVLRELLADPDPHDLRWVFTKDPGYEPILREAGWRESATLANGLRVWEVDHPVPPVPRSPRRTGLLAIWWGTVPLATLAAAIALGWWSVRDALRTARRPVAT